MSYRENYFDKRLDPNQMRIVKSVVSLLLNHYPEKQIQVLDTYKISKYAYGTDYHSVLKINSTNCCLPFNPQLEMIMLFVDSAPILDKAMQKSGLGLIGKKCNLITQKWFVLLIAELVIDLELDYDQSTTDHCGTCTACIDACPTQAIVSPMWLMVVNVFLILLSS
jgi:epoxyqueuosine reductase